MACWGTMEHEKPDESAPALIRNLCLDELREQRERSLPTEVTGFGRDLARRVQIAEAIGVANPLVREQLEVLATEGVRRAGQPIESTGRPRLVSFRKRRLTSGGAGVCARECRRSAIFLLAEPGFPPCSDSERTSEFDIMLPTDD